MLKIETEELLINYSDIGVLSVKEKSIEFYTIIGLYNFSDQKIRYFINELENMKYEARLGPILIRYLKETDKYLIKVNRFNKISKNIFHHYVDNKMTI